MRNIPLHLLLIALMVLGGLVIHEVASRVASLAVPASQYGLLSKRFTGGTMLFAPDIMLGRAVEKLMDTEGSDAPFEHVRDTIANYDVSVANFEASVPLEHVPTPSLGMQFSVKEAYLGKLSEIGFDVLSLANNHAFDYGMAGYTGTKEACDRYGLICVGHPTEVTQASTYITKVGDVTVGILMLHTLYEEPSTTTLATILETQRNESDIQYAFIHWGDEYAESNNEAQKKLAEFLIDNGIDAVIGHHPHVVQNIEEYNGKPIFYSLGNFVFDQYWTSAVQEGFLIGVTFEKKKVTYELIPYDMLEKRSVPKLRTAEKRASMFARLLGSESFTHSERERGVLEYAR